MIVKHLEVKHKIKFSKINSNQIAVENFQKMKQETIGLIVNDIGAILRINGIADGNVYVTFQTLDHIKRRIRITSSNSDRNSEVYGGEPHLISHGSDAMNAIIRIVQ